MGIMVYSLLWVMQDLYHQPCLGAPGTRNPELSKPKNLIPNPTAQNSPKILI